MTPKHTMHTVLTHNIEIKSELTRAPEVGARYRLRVTTARVSAVYRPAHTPYGCATIWAELADGTTISYASGIESAKLAMAAQHDSVVGDTRARLAEFDSRIAVESAIEAEIYAAD